MRKRIRGKKLRTFLSLIMILLLSIVNSLAVYSEGAPNATGQGQGGGGGQGETGGEKTVVVTVTVNGLENGTETHITLEKKSEEGEPPVKVEGDTSNHQVVLSVAPGGTCTVTAGNVPGYVTPGAATLSLTKMKGNFKRDVAFTYQKMDIAVTGITLNKTALGLLKGNKEKLTAQVVPANAGSQTVSWSTSNAQVAAVDQTGMATANGKGVADITASVTDQGKVFTAKAVITVREIESYDALEKISAQTGDVVTLPATVKALLSDGTKTDVPVAWVGANLVGGKQVIVYNTAGSFSLTGSVVGTDKKVTLKIEIVGSTAIEVEKVTLNAANLSVYIGKTAEINISSYAPANANLQQLVWESSNPKIATVTRDATDPKKAVISGISAGSAAITIKTVSGKLLAQALVSVAADPTVMDPVYIMATTKDSPASVDQFGSKEEVYIRGYHLPPGNYYVEVEAKGSGEPLGEGRFQVNSSEDEVIFNLFEKTNFALTDSYSKSYFVHLSLDPSFPKGDNEDGTPKTLTDNFKIGSPVPTGFITVDVNQMRGEVFGQVDPAMRGKDVILGRELKGIEAIDTQYEDYLNPLYNPVTNPSVKKYSDEVKLVGHINQHGGVDWDVPEEVLKLGGYILLIELPQGYISNLDNVNPDSEDGALMKEVSIKRDQTVTRQITIQKVDDPAGGGTIPDDDGTEPGGDGTVPGGGGTTPGDTGTNPGDGGTTPGDTGTNPGGSTDPQNPPANTGDGEQTPTVVKKSKITIKPTVKNNKASFDDAEIELLAEKGTVELDVNSSEGLADFAVVLSKKQIETLKNNHGQLMIQKGNVHLNIPSSVFTNGNEETTVTFKKLNSILNSLSAVYDLTIQQGDKTISQFNEGISLTLSVDPLKVKNPENVKIYYYNEAKGVWELVGGVYKNGQVTTTVKHFSKYTVFETTNLLSTNTNNSYNLVTVSSNQEGASLPDTSANMYNWILAGGLLFIIGLGLNYFHGKKA